MNENYKNLNPTILVIFGITGDLSRQKLIPALFHLHRKGMLPKLFQIIGFSRQELTDADLRVRVKEIVGALSKDDVAMLESFLQLFTYRQGFFNRKQGYAKLAEYLGRTDDAWKICSNKLFYLAVPPQYYPKIFTNLASTGLTEPCSPEEGWTRVIVEKPFGKNLRTAQGIDERLGKLFNEEQIYRIDHYLGKETVQNILAFRFSNSFLEPAWDRNSIESIHVRLWEEIGVDRRGEFYDGVGALRDVGQNHLLQMLALFTMERPKNFSAEEVRRGRYEALRALKIIPLKEIPLQTVRAQYEAYETTKGVKSNSKTETYFKITASLQSPRFKGVPIYLEAGKKMPEAKAEIVVVFKPRSPYLCNTLDGSRCANVLRYKIQPDEGVSLSFWVKRPGSDMAVEEKDFSFNYRASYDKHLFIEPYEKLILDTIQGNQTLFVSTDEIKASWRFIDPIVRAWKKNLAPLSIYAPGTVPENTV